jgi:hypothetical protein
MSRVLTFSNKIKKLSLSNVKGVIFFKSGIVNGVIIEEVSLRNDNKLRPCLVVFFFVK